MRLTINLEDDLYAVAKSLARAEDSTISSAVNKLVRRGLEPVKAPRTKSKLGLPVVQCDRQFTSEDVYSIDQELG